VGLARARYIHVDEPYTYMKLAAAVLFGLARTIDVRCIYGILGREITRHTVIYGVYIYSSGQPYI